MGITESSARLDAFLRNPRRSVALDRLAAHWHGYRLLVRLERPHALDGPLEVTHRVKGALGGRLARAASPRALDGGPCPWTPMCALDILMREQLRVKGHGLPKPFVLSVEPAGMAHLDVAMTLFGAARERAAQAAGALVEALAHHVDFHRRAPSVTGAKIAGVAGEPFDGIELPPPPAPAEGVALDFLTPFDASGRAAEEAPSTLVARLARRVDGLSRWMGLEIDADWAALSAHWKALDYAFREYGGPHAARKGSARQDRWYSHTVREGELEIRGDLAPLWPILVAGQMCFAGRGAVSGQGRYTLVAPR